MTVEYKVHLPRRFKRRLPVSHSNNRAERVYVRACKSVGDKRMKHNAYVEIGIVKYPDYLESGVFGFTELSLLPLTMSLLPI